jgi:FkbM family methyltransferase
LETEVKEDVKRLLASVLSSLLAPAPRRIKRALSVALVQTMMPDDRYLLASHIARSLNIARFTVGGTQGVFEGLSADLSILRSYASEGAWAARTLQLLTDALRGTSGTYIDIGANIGLTLIPIAKHCSRCYGFEPEPRNFECLTHNVSRNLAGDAVQVFQLALSNESGVAQLSLAESNLGDHCLVTAVARPLAVCPQTEERREILVRVEPLDELNLTISDPLVVKIDAQGAEPMIIQGGRKTLSRAKLMVMEFSPYHIARLWGSADDVIEFFQSNFAEILIGVGEHHPFRSDLSKDETIRYLSKFFAENRLCPDGYIDVAALNP